MTKSQLTKIEKQIAEKVQVPEQKSKGGKFVVDVERMKQLAQKLSQYELKPHVTDKL